MKTKKSKKGQAALEYLTTYSWAILLITVVLAALFWLGIFDPMSRVPESCSFQPGIKCDSIKITVDTNPTGSQHAMIQSNLHITNQFTESINICMAKCTAEEPAPPYPFSMENCASNRLLVLGPGSSGVVPLSIGCKDENGNYFSVKPGETIRTHVYLYYVRQGDVGGPRVSTGDILTTIQSK